MTTQSGHIIKVSKVTKTYQLGDVEVTALQGVDMEINRGEFAALAGPSGSGKSTLLNLVSGLDRPTSGDVWVDGKHTTDLSDTELSHVRRDRIGFVFQSYNLIPVLTALENAEYILMLQGKPPKERRDRVMELLKIVGLEGREHRFPRELSGGQQQRVAIARAIAAEPALVLADEPTANVDSRTGAALLDLMQKLHEERGVTFLFSTHDHAVMRRAQRLIYLKDGLISYDGHPKEGLDAA